MSRRNGETDCVHFRSDRAVQINGKWYFMSRESEQPIGPFANRKGVNAEINFYKHDLEKVANPTLRCRMYARELN